MIKQSIEGASVDIRGAARLPDATGGIVAADEADSTKDELPGRRSRMVAENGKSFRQSTLKHEKEKINEQLQRRCSTVGDLLFC